MDFYNTHSA